MRAQQQATSRYQLIQGPWFHVTAGQGLNYHGLNMDGVALAWFDRWLKGIDTGITQTQTPLHLEDLANRHWYDASRYPLDQARPTAYYLQTGNRLAAARPNKASSPDTLVFTGLEVPCSQAADQWGAGLGQLVLSYFGITDPCVSNDHLSPLGPGIQSYTTAPFNKATTLAGPIGAALYATSTSPDTEWVVQLYDLAPGGSARSLTEGLLEGNQRAMNRSLTWYANSGHPLLPYHPYTKSTQKPAEAGRVTRYDVEIFPTFDTLAPGHRLRVTISTADFPHALPSIAQTPRLLLGVYGLEHTPRYPSSLELPLISGTRGLAPISSGPLP
jgi:putative CocE/NonD family hydrolase